MSTLTIPETAKKMIFTYVGLFGIVVVLMMALGVLMRATQGGMVALGEDLFYQVMTAHGVGMVGIAGLGGAAVMWYFLRRHVELHTGMLVVNLLLFLTGVVLILGSIFVGGFAAGWTFLFPLPGQSAGVWSAGAAVTFLAGLLIIGVGFLLLFLDTGYGILKRYGSFAKSLGWPQLFGHDDGNAPPPAVVAGTLVTIINTLALIAGAAILVMMIINILVPAFQIDALFAKNLIFFFGHTFINATIYMAVIAVYEVMSEYTNRQWKVNKVFLAAWTASLLMVLVVYPHHLLMDFAMPTWMLVMGQVISYTSALPVILVTAIGTLAIVYRSGIRWDMAPSLLFLSVFGWAAGVVPAVIDGTISINQVMHNTMWVPGHFHFYLILGVAAMVFGFMYYLAKTERTSNDCIIDRASFWLYTVGGTIFVMTFLFSGKEGVARRFAVHFTEWQGYATVATWFALLIVIAAAAFTVHFLISLRPKKT